MATERDPDMKVVRVPWDKPIEYDTLVLDKIRFRAAVPFSSQVIETMKVHQWQEFATDTLVLALEAEILAEKLAEKTHHIEREKIVTFSVPSSWWQHLKRSVYGSKRISTWTSNKLHRIFGQVKNETITRKVTFSETVVLEQFATFPASPIQTPKEYRGHQIFRFERKL